MTSPVDETKILQFGEPTLFPKVEGVDWSETLRRSRRSLRHVDAPPKGIAPKSPDDPSEWLSAIAKQKSNHTLEVISQVQERHRDHSEAQPAWLSDIAQKKSMVAIERFLLLLLLLLSLLSIMIIVIIFIIIIILFRGDIKQIDFLFLLVVLLFFSFFFFYYYYLFLVFRFFF